MLRIYRYNELGKDNLGWLDTHYHFSFAEYHNKDRMGFGVLRVINDDVIEAGTGFPLHPHNNMEIITYVKSGAITHKDSQKNEGKTSAGDVQVMSAGSGIFHSEYNLEKKKTALYQIWIKPKIRDVKPRWETKEFPKEEVKNSLKLLVSGEKGKAPLYINQDAEIYAGKLSKGSKIKHNIKRQAYILISTGKVSIEGNILSKGDGAEVTDQDAINIEAKTNSEILVIDVPPQ